MEDFALRGAWAKGASFLAERFAAHALILIAAGILAPIALHYAVTGEAGSPFLPSVETAQAEANQSIPFTLLFVGALFALQLGSYFGSWRVGVDGRRSLWAALGWGLVVGALLTAAATGLGFAGGYLIDSAPPTLAFLLLLCLMLGGLALLYPVLAAFLSVMVMVLVLIGMAFVGTDIGAVALMALGGAGSNGVVAFAFAALALWIAARSCCTGPIMAERGSFNYFSALTASWRETGFEQFRILGLLALVGLVLTVVALVLLLLLGAAAWRAGEAFQDLGEVGYIAGTLLVGVPFAFLTVMIPAGIYRELTRAPAADVFA